MQCCHQSSYTACASFSLKLSVTSFVVDVEHVFVLCSNVTHCTTAIQRVKRLDRDLSALLKEWKIYQATATGNPLCCSLPSSSFGAPSQLMLYDVLCPAM
mgnify:CR=1 FL=1